MKIYFVGDMRSPFIQQDFNLLIKMGHQLRAFDLSVHASSFKQIPLYLLAALAEMLQVRSAFAVWIWFADYPALPFMLLAKFFRKKTVVNVGGWEVYKAPEIHYGNQLNPIRGACTRWIIRNADRIIVPSEAYRKIVLALVPESNVVVVHGFVPKELTDAPLPVKEDKAVTAYCTNSTWKLKGLHIFRMLPHVTSKKTEMIKNIPHDQLMAEFRCAKVYCQLSYTESFGMSLLEAMACGCVPVVTDRDALPEVVGDVGQIVPYDNLSATAYAVTVAMTMDGSKARERARMFTEEKREESIRKLLWDVI